MASRLTLDPYICKTCLRDLSRTRPFLSQSRQYHRPPIAPKPTLDIKHITKNPGLYEQNCISRRYDAHARSSWRILELTKRRAELRDATADLRNRNADTRRKIEKLRRTERDSKRQLTENPMMAGLMQSAKQMKEELAGVTREEEAIETEITELAIGLPNLSSQETPDGDKPAVISQQTAVASTRNIAGVSHVDIGTELGILDFAAAASTSGWGWYFLTHEAALLEQALVQLAVATLLRRGWSVVSPPTVVYAHIGAACGFQPRDANDEQQIYQLARPERERSATDKPVLSLAGTAEIPLAGMNANRTLALTDAPLKTVAVGRCFRAEAGARGVDTKGLYRVHEFTKVEMFAWTVPDDFGEQTFNDGEAVRQGHAQAVFEEMVAVQQEILTVLGLRHRVLEMPAHELGASASRKIDIEVFFPSRTALDQGWGEVTSASICTDYQSRRLATRVRMSDGSLDWPYTLNGTAMAVPRVLAAILENHWDPDEKVVRLPEALVPYMHGIREIRKK